MFRGKHLYQIIRLIYVIVCRETYFGNNNSAINDLPNYF